MGEELMRKVWSICADRYGAALPDVIFNRLQQELQNITVNGFSEDYLSTSGICLELQHRNALQICLGTVGNSFVAYLLGITEISPPATLPLSSLQAGNLCIGRFGWI